MSSIFREKKMENNYKDLTGQRIGNWTVLEDLGTRLQGKKVLVKTRYYKCLCKCGNVAEVSASNLSGKRKRCMSCLSLPKFYKSEYASWSSMKQRCSNSKTSSYKYYGQRGIFVCKEWNDSFSNFLNDMGRKPAGFSLERVNNDKGYSPENCIWADWKTQANNKREYQTKTSNDEFAGLPLSRERKRQLRSKKKGICVRSCSNPIYKCDLCELHYKEKKEYYKRYQERRKIIKENVSK